MMNDSFLKSILACPKCKNPLKNIKKNGNCTKCRFHFKRSDRIWHFLYIQNRTTKNSHKSYDLMHNKFFGGPNDGSYQILASIAKGNNTVDIACGEGLIEKLSPDTVGVEFSINALKKAKKMGAKYLILADAHNLPFRNNSFDIALSAGSLEHLANPQKAINEMARISKMQILTVHKHPPIPFATFFHDIISRILSMKHQPIEKPIPLNQLVRMLEKAKLKVIFKGDWTLPFNYGRVIKFLPEFKSIPSCSFVVSIKK